MSICKIISPLIASQFPNIYLEEGPNLVAFIKAYYEWMEQEGNVGYMIRSIQEYRDLDTTLNEFLSYFQNDYLAGLPSNILSDKTLLIKHIKEFYLAKGSFRATQLLFRMVFNEDVEINKPGDFVLRASDGQWTLPQYIEVSDSPYLQDMVGTKIYGTTTKSTAIVEQYVIKNINNKVINVLMLSSLNGKFAYGELVISENITGMNPAQSPIIFGSLSSISIIQGGANYNIGDILSVQGSGFGAQARVIGTETQNGKVTFNLLNGGYGYSMDAVVQVAGGYGSGASFEIGALVDQQIFNLNTDKINLYYDTEIDQPSYGYILYYTGLSGQYTIGEYVTQSSNVVTLDVKYLSGSPIQVGDTISNSSLGISGLTVSSSDSTYLVVTGNNAMLAAVGTVPGSGMILKSSSNAVVSVNSTFPMCTITGNGTVTHTNSTSVTINNISGLTVNSAGQFINQSIVHGVTSGAIATVTNAARQTNWNFPSINIPNYTNLDVQIQNVLTNITKVIGTISYINGIDPGEGYSTNPVVTVTDPLIIDLQIDDGNGNFWGNDAIVTGIANSTSGIVTNIQIVDSGFGYEPNEILELSSNNVTVVTGIASIDLNGVSAGYWKDNRGFLSDINYLQDSDYYQAYSYELIASRMLSSYQQLVEDFVHPCGMKLFGKYSLKDNELSTTSTIISSSIVQTAG